MNKRWLFFVPLLLIVPFSFMLKDKLTPKTDQGVQHNIQLGIEKASDNYKNYCAGCHGNKLEAFADRRWVYGNSEEDLVNAIKYGYVKDGMPAFDTTFTEEEINGLVNYIQNGIANIEKFNFEEDVKVGETVHSEELDFTLETITKKIEVPWGMAFLKNGNMLVTDKKGKLYRIAPNGEHFEIKGVPEVVDRGQGGLMDVALHPQFESNHVIYLSFSKPHQYDKDLATTAILKAKLKKDELINQTIIFEALPYANTHHHFGSRIEFDNEGYLYFSVGDRGKRDQFPQSLVYDPGKIHRVYDDGRIPDNNPFVNRDGTKGSIFTYGHRNPQGLAKHPVTGAIWSHEHGPKGGDEINLLDKGKNYGWPVISYGINYNGTIFTNITEQAGMEQPKVYWVPSIAPCGMTFVNSDKYGNWKNNILVGSLRFQYLERVVLDGDKVVHQELLLKNIGRVRSAEVDHEGYIYVSVERPGAIYKIVPERNNP